MPYRSSLYSRRRRTARRKRTRNYRRPARRITKGKMRPTNLTRSRILVGFPPCINMKMRWSGSAYGTIAAGASVNYCQSTNLQNLDPLIAGNQRPLYWNETVAIYDRWFVKGIAYKIVMVNRNNSASLGTLFFNIQPRDTQTMDFNPDTANQRWYDKQRLISQGTHVIKGYVQTGQPYGYDRKKTWYDESFWGANTSAPTNLMYLNMLLQNPAGGTATDYYITFEMTFYCHWKELKDVAAS